jgi:hypothetical protein
MEGLLRSVHGTAIQLTQIAPIKTTFRSSAVG